MHKPCLTHCLSVFSHIHTKNNLRAGHHNKHPPNHPAPQSILTRDKDKFGSAAAAVYGRNKPPLFCLALGHRTCNPGFDLQMNSKVLTSSWQPYSKLTIALFSIKIIERQYNYCSTYCNSMRIWEFNLQFKLFFFFFGFTCVFYWVDFFIFGGFYLHIAFLVTVGSIGPDHEQHRAAAVTNYNRGCCGEAEKALILGHAEDSLWRDHVNEDTNGRVEDNQKDYFLQGTLWNHFTFRTYCKYFIVPIIINKLFKHAVVSGSSWL